MAFDNVDREILWKLLRYYGVPDKIISLIRVTYKDLSCKIDHASQLSESFEVKTGESARGACCHQSSSSWSLIGS